MDGRKQNDQLVGNREMVDSVGRIENYGVDFIPEEQRKSNPLNIFWILFGGSMTFGIIIIGWIPVSLGLGWWDSVSAIVVGSIIGSTLLAPMSLFGVRTGTNNPVSSGAHFGAVGRLIGSVLGILACIVFAALCVWSAGDVLSGSTARIFGNSEADMTLKIIAYTAVAIVMTIIAVLGHANMVAFSKLMIPTAGVLMIIGIFVFLPNFDAGYQGGDYALGTFWPTWFLGTISVAATTNSYGPYVGDWSRHISRRKYSDKNLMFVTWLGGFFGMGGAYLFGAYTAVTFANPTANYATELVANSPFWYLFPLLFIGLIAGTAQAVINIYSMGLDFSAIVTRFSRVQATILLSAVSTVLVYLGAFYDNLSTLVSSFLGILVIMGAPWVVINVIGFINRRGHYYADHLQVFNRGEIGGRYWFASGINIQATTAWLAGTFVGVFFINTGWYVGPGAKLFGGADIGLLVSMLVSLIVYTALLYTKPEPKCAFGPNGAFFKSSNEEGYMAIRKKLTSSTVGLLTRTNNIKKTP